MLRFSANLSTLFQDRPLLERLPAAKAAGFEAVEVWFPYEIDANRLADALATHGLVCVGINSPAGQVAAGDWGLATDPGQAVAFDTSIELAMRYAKTIDCPNVHVMAGQPGGHVDLAVAWETYRSSLQRAVEVAESHGRKPMIEPLNAIDRPRYLLQRQEQAISLIEEIGSSRLALMLDLFHLQRGEGNLIERMRRSLPYAAHVQIADVPGRHEPGTGEIHFENVFAELEKAGWAGWIGAEYLPLAGTLEGLGWMHKLAR
jgi:hydroxypyruvate isomerase